MVASARKSLSRLTGSEHLKVEEDVVVDSEYGETEVIRTKKKKKKKTKKEKEKEKEKENGHYCPRKRRIEKNTTDG